MLFGCDNAQNADFEVEKLRLTREADEAFSNLDRITCINAINQLYNLLDDAIDLYTDNLPQVSLSYSEPPIAAQ